MKLSAYPTVANRIRTVQIEEVRTESPSVKTFSFKDTVAAKAEPGQFIMLWIPGVDEIPLSVLSVEKNGLVSVAVKKVGEATQRLHEMKAGETVGVRGSLGNSFTYSKGNVLMVGGGTGIAPLLFLSKRLARLVKITFVFGAKTKEELLLHEQIEKACGESNVVATTEDGSHGIKCLATAPLVSLFAKEKFDIVYTCGPERMMRKVFDLAEKHETHVEASLERLMRCGIGLCGSCVIGKYRVCRDGPVFTSKQLGEVKGEFGVSKRDFDGKRVSI